VNEITSRPVVMSPVADSGEVLHHFPARAVSFNLTNRARLHLFYGGIFSLLVLLNCALLPVTGVLFFRSTLPGPNMWLITLLLGAHLGQWVLLAIWMSFGCFRTPWRQLICTVLVFGGSSYICHAMSVAEMSLAVALMVTAIFWFMYAGLTTLRMVSFITIEFRSLQSTAPRWARRFSIASMMTFTLMLAIPCALLQWAASIHAEILEASIVTGLMAFVLMIALTPLSLALVSTRRTLLWSSLALILFGSITGLVFLARSLIGPEASLVMIGSGIIVVLNLGLLRCIGLRWLPTVAASSDVDSEGSASPILN
jgi:hypothetical protein